MARIYMVRHGKAAAGFGENMDPGLDALGQSQAEAVAQHLRSMGPLPILSSPLRRTQETAMPLTKLWDRKAIIESAVAEIPSPKGLSHEDRVVWLRKVMAGSWRSVTPELAEWREACIAAIAALGTDTVIFSHYVAINVLAGHATADDRVVNFSPENCSVTRLEVRDGQISLLGRGTEAPLTKVN